METPKSILWDLMKVVFDGNSCLGMFSFSSSQMPDWERKANSTAGLLQDERVPALLVQQRKRN